MSDVSSRVPRMASTAPAASIAPIALSGDASLLRRMNLRAVLRVLHAGGLHTISALAKASQISRPTTKQAVDDLLEAGWISVSGSAQRPTNMIGRPAQTFEFRPDAGHVLGVDIGANKAVALISDLNGTVKSRARHTLDPQWGAARRVTALDEVIVEALAGFAPGRAAVTDAVIATPGVVDLNGAIAHCTVIPEWEGQRLGEHVAEQFGLRAEAANDMMMAALAEHWRGAARESDAIVYLHAGRRLGTALLIAGRPYRGHHGAATEIGLWRGLGWAPAYDRFLQLPHDESLTPGEAVKKVFEDAAAGDLRAQARIDDFAADLSEGLAPIIVAVDPELLVIGGGMSAAGEAIAEPLRARIGEETPFAPKVVCSVLGDESVALGSVRMALDRAEERLFAELALPAAWGHQQPRPAGRHPLVVLSDSRDHDELLRVEHRRSEPEHAQGPSADAERRPCAPGQR